MPIYEYACPACGHQFEKLQKMGAAAPTCPACGDAGPERKVSLSAFHLKGSGWYSTDYKSSGGSGTGDTGGASDAGGGESGGSSSDGGHTCGSGCGHAH